jgi:hypothetical protein
MLSQIVSQNADLILNSPKENLFKICLRKFFVVLHISSILIFIKGRQINYFKTNNSNPYV